MTLLVKYRANFIFNSEFHSWQWVKVDPIEDEGELITKYKHLSEKTAERIIRKEGLVCVERDVAMQIWDTPLRDFQKKYKHKIKVEDL